MQEINDELMMPCAVCCRKHLSAAIAHYADAFAPGHASPAHWEVLVARAMVNVCEATEGYVSHLPFAVGLCVRAEEECGDIVKRNSIRSLRLALTAGEWGPVTEPVYPSATGWYFAHVAEAEREFPDIRTAVEREPFYRDNMSEPELRQAEVNYRLAQLKWLDENVFGYEPKEKGEEEMACKAKKAAVKGGKAMPAKGKAKGKCKACGK